MARIRSNFWGGVTNGTQTDDEIIGSSFNDVINGRGGNDVILAGNGNDVIDGGAGADSMNGGADTDTVTYANAPSDASGNWGVSVNLFRGQGSWGDAEGDTYTSIENVTGSQFVDALMGNSGNNVLNGLGGNDVISGGAGADTMDGGAGVDMLSYFYFANSYGAAMPQSTGVFVNLATNTAFGGHAEGDVISNFENVRGSAGSDTLIGSNGDNTLEGYTGNDTIDGAGGRDTLWGDSGNDVIRGGSGDDFIAGGSDNDTLTGGTGADMFFFNILDPYAPGVDRIMDFEHGVDRIRFDIEGNGNFAELNFTQSGGSTIITYDDVPGSLTLVGVEMAELTASDFEFV